MTLCSIVSAVQAVRTAVAAMRARCGVPAGTALEPVNTATLAGDGGGRGLLADIYWKTAAAVETLALLETVARPITPGEQVCHANPWIDQVRAWIDGIMPSAVTIVGAGFSGGSSVLNVAVLASYAGLDFYGRRYWESAKDQEGVFVLPSATLTFASDDNAWRAELTNSPWGVAWANGDGQADALPPTGQYAITQGQISEWPSEYAGATITVLQGDQT
jgi:hypothetical protein